MMRRLYLSLKHIVFRKRCAHQFDLSDLEQSKLVPLKKPDTNGYDEWDEYFKQIHAHESHTKRVSWKCSLCGEVFHAHCGLDILADKDKADAKSK